MYYDWPVTRTQHENSFVSFFLQVLSFIIIIIIIIIIINLLIYLMITLFWCSTGQ